MHIPSAVPYISGDRLLQKGVCVPAQYAALVASRLEGFKVEELCESRGGRLGLSVLTSLLVSVDVKIY